MLHHTSPEKAMAERRMFTRRIVKTDAFTDMPASSQNLYFHLGMEADDDGFVSNPRLVMRQLNAVPDDMNILVAKRFIIPFESGIVLIKHWHMHNHIKKDRYQPSSHYKERESIMVKENGAYSLRSGTPMNIWNQVGVNSDTQVRIGKDSIGKKLKVEIEAHNRNFERFWTAYPRKVAKQACKRWWDTKTFTDEEVEQMLTAVKRYQNTKQWQGGFIPHPRTFLNQGRWEDEITEDAVKPAETFKSYT